MLACHLLVFLTKYVRLVFWVRSIDMSFPKDKLGKLVDRLNLFILTYGGNRQFITFINDYSRKA